PRRATPAADASLVVQREGVRRAESLDREAFAPPEDFLVDQHLNSRSCSTGCEPVPETMVALLPRLSVTVSVIDNACAAPASVLPGPPQVSPNVNDELGPDCVTVLSVP